MTDFIGRFRAALAEQGHPQERIDWLAGLVTVEGLPDAKLFVFGTGTVNVDWYWGVAFVGANRLQVHKYSLWITVESSRIAFEWIVQNEQTSRWTHAFTGNYRAIAELVWQDALAALGVKSNSPEIPDSSEGTK